jgi:hypothetical protein
MADIQVANSDADLSDNTLVTEENAYTITGLHTYSRSTNAPFAVVSGAAVVANLDADKLDGQQGSYYLAAANFTGTLAVNRGGTGAATFTDGGVLLGSGTGAITPMAVLGDGVILIGDASGDPTTLDVGSSTAITTLGTVATGVWQGDEVVVTYGGTGRATLTDGGILIGKGTAAINQMAVLADGEMVVGDGTTDPVAEGGATLRTSIGVGTGDSPQFTGIELGHATDTTLTKASSGDVNIEGNVIYRAGGTDVPVTDGGTGVGTLTDGGVLLGNGTGDIQAMSVLADSEMIVGDGTTDPVAETGATLRTSIGCDVATNITSGTMATARLGSGTASSATYLRGDQSWAALSGSPIVGYTATTAAVSNTTSKSPVVTIGQIGANDWDDGDILTIHLAVLGRNYSGAERTLTWEVDVEGNTQTHVKAWENISAIGYMWWDINLIRAGAEIFWFFTNDQVGRSGMNPGSGSALRIASVDFTAAIDVVVNITFPAADAALYITPQSANAYITKRTT